MPLSLSSVVTRPVSPRGLPPFCSSKGPALKRSRNRSPGPVWHDASILVVYKRLPCRPGAFRVGPADTGTPPGNQYPVPPAGSPSVFHLMAATADAKSRPTRCWYQTITRFPSKNQVAYRHPAGRPRAPKLARCVCPEGPGLISWARTVHENAFAQLRVAIQNQGPQPSSVITREFPRSASLPAGLHEGCEDCGRHRALRLDTVEPRADHHARPD